MSTTVMWLLNGWRGIALAFLAAFLLTMLAGKIAIPILQKMKFGQVVRDDGPQKHLSKQGTPTMGGVIFVAGSLIAFWFFFGLMTEWGRNEYAEALPAALLTTVSTLGFAGVGFADDALKVIHKNPKGLSPRWKLLCQFILGAVLSIWADAITGVGDVLIVPWSGYEWKIGWAYVPLMIVVLVAIVNSVNLTDGLDGQSASLTLIDCIAYILILGILSNTILSKMDLKISNDMGAMHHLMMLRYFLASFAGALLAYLVYNVYPARLFMGDTGSFAMGGALSAAAMISRTALIVPLIGICFVASSVSAILQVGSYKLRGGKRIFLMAPLHHHFELKGYPETKVVEWYRIATCVACAVALTAF